MLPPQVASLAGKAIKAVERSGPDPVVFIFLGAIFLASAPFIEPKWLPGLMLCILPAVYCWRRSQSEKNEIMVANLKLEQELAKIQAKKNTHRIAKGAIQPLLPLSSVPSDETTPR